MRSPAAFQGVLFSVILGSSAGLAMLETGCGASRLPGIWPSERGLRDEPPPPLREFRAMWVATASNLDWPSKRGLSTAEQQRQIDQIIERARDLKLNAIILQIRGASNAIYAAEREPWAGLLTGTRGQAPNPFYDPLAMWIEKCHRNGIELHAWLIPFWGYREPVPRRGNAPNPTTVPYGDVVWYDPGDSQTQDYTIDVFTYALMKYDVDGMHIDHFFYPYGTTTDGPIEFPDDKSYEHYVHNRGHLRRADWRRDNINRFIERLYREIKRRKSWVKFGISPFGIPRPGVPSYARGFDPYERNYADAPLWLRKGWCDYMVPELYWRTGAPHQPFLGLLQWWVDPENNPKGRRIYAGLCTSKIDSSPTSWSPDEIAGQVMITRMTPGATGHVHFSTRALAQNRKGIADLLVNELYTDAALVPTMPWLGRTPPEVPARLSAERLLPPELRAATPERVAERGPEQPPAIRAAAGQPFVPLAPKPPQEAEKRRTLSGFRITWKHGGPGQAVRVWAVYHRCGATWTMQVVPGHLTEAIIRDDPTAGPASRVAVSAVDRLGNESKRATLDLASLGKN